jgi:transcriptional regulator with XRE-family HTH domain
MDASMFLQKETVASLRGRQSQMQLSRRLGFTYNQVNRWELGRARMDWPAFERLCRVASTDLEGALFHALTYKGKAKDYGAIVRLLCGGRPVSAAATSLGLSRHKLDRWVTNKVPPTLLDMLRIFDAAAAATTDFLVKLCGERATEALRQEMRLALRRKALAAAHPLSAAAELVFVLPEYEAVRRHRRGYLAGRLGISVDQEEKLIQAMVDCELLKFTKGKYELTLGPSSLSTKPPAFADHATIIKYWLTKAAAKIDAETHDRANQRASVMNYRVLAVSQKAYDEIMERFVQFYREIGLIVRDDDESPTQLAVMAQQVFSPLVD